MTLNELIQQLQTIVQENPKAGECEVYTPYNNDGDSVQLRKEELFFSVSTSEINSYGVYACGNLPTFEEAEEYLQDGIKDGGFDEYDFNRIVFQIGCDE